MRLIQRSNKVQVQFFFHLIFAISGQFANSLSLKRNVMPFSTHIKIYIYVFSMEIVTPPGFGHCQQSSVPLEEVGVLVPGAGAHVGWGLLGLSGNGECGTGMP